MLRVFEQMSCGDTCYYFISIYNTKPCKFPEPGDRRSACRFYTNSFHIRKFMLGADYFLIGYGFGSSSGFPTGSTSWSGAFLPICLAISKAIFFALPDDTDLLNLKDRILPCRTGLA